MITHPEPYGHLARKESTVPLWTRVRARSRTLFAVDRTPYEMALVFEALQDANERVEALEEQLREMRLAHGL